MGKITAIIQAASAGLLTLWAVFMAVRMLAGGYDLFYAVCFGIMAALGYGMLRASVKEMKGGAK